MHGFAATQQERTYNYFVDPEIHPEVAHVGITDIQFVTCENLRTGGIDWVTVYVDFTKYDEAGNVLPANNVTNCTYAVDMRLWQGIGTFIADFERMHWLDWYGKYGMEGLPL